MKVIKLQIDEEYYEHAKKVSDSEPYIYGPEDYLNGILNREMLNIVDKAENPLKTWQIEQLESEVSKQNIQIDFLKDLLRQIMVEYSEEINNLSLDVQMYRDASKPECEIDEDEDIPF